MTFEKILEAWTMSCIIVWLLFIKKPKEITPGSVGASLFLLLLMPLWFIIFIPLFWYHRGKLKWIRKWWWLIAIKRVFDYSFGWRHTYNLTKY